MSVNLTTGSIETILSGVDVNKPVLQILGSKKMPSSGGTDRYRLLLSDGVHSYSSAMLATQLNSKIESNEMDNNSIVRLDKYLCNQVQPDRRVMILLEVTVLAQGSSVGTKVGNPQSYNKSAAANSTGSASSTLSAPASSTANSNSASNLQNRTPLTPKQQTGNFYSNAQSKFANKPVSVNTPPKTPGGSVTKVHPISSLTPYQNRWTIRARLTSKSAIRTWSNSKGEGKLFSMTFLDDSGEIRATAFREQVDQFYEMLELNKVYYVTKGSLKTADKRYSSVNNDYEMTFGGETQIWPCNDATDLPSLSFNFIPLNKLDSHQANEIIDVIGVVRSSQDLATIVGKQSNKEIKKRDLSLVDETKMQIRVTLWGNDAESFEQSGSPILALKGCKLSDWGGRSISALSSSQVIFNPDIQEAHHLRGWFDNVGHFAEFSEFEAAKVSGSSSTNWKQFSQIKVENCDMEKGEYFTTKGTIMFLKKENCMYTACPSDGCNKKVIDQGNGNFRCEKCNREFPNHKWRMILSCNIADFTDNQWATCFQDTAELILGQSADQIGYLKSNNENEFDELFQEANFKSYIFKFRSKMETYNDESRIKTVCMQANPVVFTDYSKKLLDDIQSMLHITL